jgi:hypothetical protein
MNSPVCPICQAEVPLSGEERPGDAVYCSYCEIELRLKRTGKEWEVEEGYD